MTPVRTADDIHEARRFLARRGAPRRLMGHGDLVAQVVGTLCGRLKAMGIALDCDLAETGAILHDVGKLVVPEELSGPGQRHGPIGADLLLAAGWPASLARFCVSHIAWHEANCSLEELLVALADHLWKGKRQPELEERVIRRVAELSGRDFWPLFSELDDLFESIAGDADKNLANSGISETD